MSDRVISVLAVLDGRTTLQAKNRLKPLKFKDNDTKRLYYRILQTWNSRRCGGRIILSLSRREREILWEQGVVIRPKLVKYKYVAIYRRSHSREEVVVRSLDRPAKYRTFKSRSKKDGAIFRRRKLYKVKQPKESQVAKKKAAEVDEDLEELEELEDLEEPEDEDEEEEEKPKRKKRAKKEKAAPKKRRRKSKKSEPEEDEDEEDEDDEDEDDEDDEEEEAPKKKSSKKSKKSAKKSGKKSKKSSGDSAAGRTTKEMTGGVGTAELAEAASDIAEVEIDGREVRIYLRKNEIPKDEEHGRYVWPSEKNKEFKKLAKAIAAHYGDEDDE